MSEDEDDTQLLSGATVLANATHSVFSHRAAQALLWLLALHASCNSAEDDELPENLVTTPWPYSS